MNFIRDFIHHPRRLFIRRALFQIHLWSGVFVSLYIVVIALTGALLVFEDELTATTLPSQLNAYDEVRHASIPAVVQTFRNAYPGGEITFLTTPSPTVPAYQIRAKNANKRAITLVADPVTAGIYTQPRTWVEWVHDLHLYLLLGSAHGVQVNGIGAAILLLLSITGIVLWWPGLKSWTRGFRISLRHNWRRINFDVHHFIGIWTFALVCWWAISGVYFAWYRQVGSVVNSISHLRGMMSPELPSLPIAGSNRASLESILAAAQKASPQGRLFGLSDPSLAGRTVFAQMDLRASGDFSHRDIVTIDTANGRVLSVWHYGQNQTAGDWMMWAMHPLHFGTLWGLAFKVIWFLMGLSLAVLSVTGLLMYWNRRLRHLFRRTAKVSVSHRSSTDASSVRNQSCARGGVRSHTSSRGTAL